MAPPVAPPSPKLSSGTKHLTSLLAAGVPPPENQFHPRKEGLQAGEFWTLPFRGLVYLLVMGGGSASTRGGFITNDT